MYHYYYTCKVTYYTTNNVLCDVYMCGDVRKTHERNPILPVAKRCDAHLLTTACRQAVTIAAVKQEIT